MDTLPPDSPSPETNLPFPEDKEPIDPPNPNPPGPPPPSGSTPPGGKGSPRAPKPPRAPKASKDDADDDLGPCPGKSPELGDMTPEYVIWQIRNDPKAANAMYRDRLDRLPSGVRELLEFGLQATAQE